MNELALVEAIRKRAGASRRLVLGIGDDCAVYRPRSSEDLLFTSDQLIEEVHFKRGAKPEVVGERALARGLSDIAAMGGEPRFCLVSLAVPHADAWVDSFFKGLMSMARRTKTALAGGDLAHAGKVYCDIVVCGAVRQGMALRRDSARVGDAIYVSGRLGRPWDRPIRPRLDLGRKLVGRATSCMDLSDGLSLDLHRLCVASKVAADVDRVPVFQSASVERALHGGEDYELLFTLPENTKAPTGTTRIGTIVKGKPGAVRFQGSPLKPLGYSHFL